MNTRQSPDWRDDCDGATYIGPHKHPTKMQIAEKLRKLADDMDDISVDMDYYGGLAEWAQHGREIAGAGKIAREWADEIETNVVMPTDSTNGWWAAMLAERTADGRRDAERGQYDLPYPGTEEDPQYEDENEAYKIGWRQRRKELGDAFKWA